MQAIKKQILKERNMKKIFSIIVLISLFVVNGCIKNDPVIFQDQLAEFDATSWNANAAGLNYPILGRIPAYGRVSTTNDSTLRRFAQTVRLRINLNGPQSPKSETVGYELFTSPVTTFAMPATASCSPANFPATCPVAWTQTPTAAAATLTVKDAVAGTHFVALSGLVTIPANSSFGFIDLQIVNPGATAGEGRFIGLKLNNSGSLKASENYSRLGLVIDQR